MTGAKIPEDADTIIPFEESVVDDDFNVHMPLHVEMPFVTKVKSTRLAGILLLKGEVLTSAKIAYFSIARYESRRSVCQNQSSCYFYGR